MMTSLPSAPSTTRSAASVCHYNWHVESPNDSGHSERVAVYQPSYNERGLLADETLLRSRAEDPGRLQKRNKASPGSSTPLPASTTTPRARKYVSIAATATTTKAR